MMPANKIELLCECPSGKYAQIFDVVSSLYMESIGTVIFVDPKLDNIRYCSKYWLRRVNVLESS